MDREVCAGLIVDHGVTGQDDETDLLALQLPFEFLRGVFDPPDARDREGYPGLGGVVPARRLGGEEDKDCPGNQGADNAGTRLHCGPPLPYDRGKAAQRQQSPALESTNSREWNL